jgi:light-regulated signal transduction histidine kinase (bacteriophytochrome)
LSSLGAARVSSRWEDAIDAPASVLAHQLGENVALLAGYTAVLRETAGLEPAGRDAIGMIEVVASRVRRCTEDLLDFTSASSAQTNPARADPAVALQQALAALHDGLDRWEVSVEAGPLPEVTADAHQLPRLFVHLLRGPAAAAWTTEAIPNVWIDGRRTASGVEITVTDDAPAPPNPDRLFDARSRPRGRGPFVGAGLGLLICRRIVEANGGQIAAEAAQPDGLAVSFTLPGAEG